MAPLVGDAAGDGDVLVARATPVGTGALAIVRLSGPAGRVLALARAMAPRIPARPLARRAYLSPFLDEEGASWTRASCSGSQPPLRRRARRSSSCRPTAPRPWSSCSSRRPSAAGRAAPGRASSRAGRSRTGRSTWRGPRGSASSRGRRAGGRPGGRSGSFAASSRAGWRRCREELLGVLVELEARLDFAEDVERAGERTALSRVVSARAALLLSGAETGAGRACDAVPTCRDRRRTECREVDAVQRAARRGPGPGDGAGGDDARRRGRGVRGRRGTGPARRHGRAAGDDREARAARGRGCRSGPPPAPTSSSWPGKRAARRRTGRPSGRGARAGPRDEGRPAGGEPGRRAARERADRRRDDRAAAGDRGSAGCLPGGGRVRRASPAAGGAAAGRGRARRASGRTCRPRSRRGRCGPGFTRSARSRGRRRRRSSSTGSSPRSASENEGALGRRGGGRGHAGAEAAWASARVGCRTLLLTRDLGAIARMSCNPAIGGLAKGQTVREIDALGGLMGWAADRTGIQFKVLNASRGPAVQGLRCQSDKAAYSREVGQRLAAQPNLELREGAAAGFVVADGVLSGLRLEDGEELRCGAAVVTSGTFLRGLDSRRDRAAGRGALGRGAVRRALGGAEGAWPPDRADEDRNAAAGGRQNPSTV